MIIKYNPIRFFEDEHIELRAAESDKTVADVDISVYNVDASALSRLFNEAEYKRSNDDAALRYVKLKAKFIAQQQLNE
ncbi:hypothetical protein [Sporosarcina sp. A2]|uniref:hypothetical protein n=1 Tax=Sporosarcina sp. A2 TaxID=3393449 RepID=UPI003D7B9672